MSIFMFILNVQSLSVKAYKEKSLGVQRISNQSVCIGHVCVLFLSDWSCQMFILNVQSLSVKAYKEKSLGVQS